MWNWKTSLVRRDAAAERLLRQAHSINEMVLIYRRLLAS
jgi:hypothetical protein